MKSSAAGALQMICITTGVDARLPILRAKALPIPRLYENGTRSGNGTMRAMRGPDSIAIEAANSSHDMAGGGRCADILIEHSHPHEKPRGALPVPPFVKRD
jgi:hypothetical protein